MVDEVVAEEAAAEEAAADEAAAEDAADAAAEEAAEEAAALDAAVPVSERVNVKALGLASPTGAFSVVDAVVADDAFALDAAAADEALEVDEDAAAAAEDALEDAAAAAELEARVVEAEVTPVCVVEGETVPIMPGVDLMLVLIDVTLDALLLLALDAAVEAELDTAAILPDKLRS